MVKGQQKTVKEKFSRVEKASDSKKEFKATSGLAQQLEKEKTERKEERSIWVIIVIILVDIVFLAKCKNWSLPLIIGIFETAIIFVLAHRWSVKPIELLFAMVYDAFQGKK